MTARALIASAALAAVFTGAAAAADTLILPTPRPTELQKLIALGRPIYCGGRSGRDVALTFDDGPGPWTATALRILRRARDQATFFVVGKLLAYGGSLVRQESRSADVGDHTWTHSNLELLRSVDVRKEIERTAVALRELTRRPVVFFRPPYGARDARVDAIVHDLGLLEILWSIDTRDSEGADPVQIAAAVDNAHPGSIILMHENRRQTLKGLLWQHALARLRALRLRAVTLTQLLTTDPPSPAQLAAGPRGCGIETVSRGG